MSSRHPGWFGRWAVTSQAPVRRHTAPSPSWAHRMPVNFCRACSRVSSSTWPSRWRADPSRNSVASSASRPQIPYASARATLMSSNPAAESSARVPSGSAPATTW
ncbi:hypothetical protein ACIBCO_30165 [Streptomyces violascens]|uniref:hypothetical protein n=1 Tax=Streptomyces violascens TaxID=67381 RepID=UPI0037992295